MLSWKLGCNAFYMTATHTQRYIYCVGKTIYVYNMESGERTEVLAGLKDAYPVVSRTDKYLGCTHPKNKKLEAVVFQIGESRHDKRLSVEIDEERGTFEQPVFTYDENYLLVTSGFPIVSLWAINVHTGEKKIVMRTDAHSVISNVICNEHGIIVVLHEHIKPLVDRPTGKILHYSSLDAKPRVISIDRDLYSNLRKALQATYLRSGAVAMNPEQLLIYYRYNSGIPESSIQIVDYLNENTIIPSPQATIPYMLSLGPEISSNGRYMAVVGHERLGSKDQVLVYRMSDLKLIYTYEDKMVWNAAFVPNTDLLLVSCSNAAVISLAEYDRQA